MTTDTDRIEKKVVLHASRARVWRAIANAQEFGKWFGMKIEGQFAPGATMRGVIVPTQVDPEVAKLQAPHEGLALTIVIEQMEPEKVFSFRWHPYAVDPKVDYSTEPTTLVTFALADAPGGVLLTVTESGFDAIPINRRAEAFAANEGGWAIQTTLVGKYLAQVG